MSSPDNNERSEYVDSAMTTPQNGQEIIVKGGRAALRGDYPRRASDPLSPGIYRSGVGHSTLKLYISVNLLHDGSGGSPSAQASSLRWRRES